MKFFINFLKFIVISPEKVYDFQKDNLKINEKKKKKKHRLQNNIPIDFFYIKNLVLVVPKSHNKFN